jgi:hypothetical protein
MYAYYTGDNIKLNLRGCEGVYWIQLVQDAFQWWLLWNSNEYLGAIKCVCGGGGLLTSWVTVSFSRRTQFRIVIHRNIRYALHKTNSKLIEVNVSGRMKVSLCPNDKLVFSLYKIFRIFLFTVLTDGHYISSTFSLFLTRCIIQSGCQTTGLHCSWLSREYATPPQPFHSA